MRLIKLTLLSLSSWVLISSCNHHHPAPNLINPELLGHWTDDRNCNLELQQLNHHLVVVSFKTESQLFLQNQILALTKESILTKFKATNPKLDFSGSFSEGFILIDQNYCHTALHKDSQH